MRISTSDTSRPANWGVWIAVFVASMAVGAGAVAIHHRIANPPEPPSPLPGVPWPTMAEQTAIREQLRTAGRLMLGITPDQEKKIEDIWQTPPQSIEDIKQREKLTNEVLLPAQRQQVDILRRGAREMIVDRMFEPGRDRFRKGEFERYKALIKQRVHKSFED